MGQAFGFQVSRVWGSGFGFWGSRVWEFGVRLSGIRICGLSGLGLPLREGPEESSSLEQAVSLVAQQALPAWGREREREREREGERERGERVLLLAKMRREKEKAKEKEEVRSRPVSRYQQARHCLQPALKSA
jgi:hypothetical protein